MVLDLETAQHRLHDLGITHPVHIASGMEGHVFRIDEERIAKTWFGKPVSDLLAIQGFYEILEALDLPFETPRILGMESVEGTTISFERALPGKPMSMWVREEDNHACLRKNGPHDYLAWFGYRCHHSSPPEHSHAGRQHR